MKRILSFILLLMLTGHVFGQLSLHTLQSNAEQNLLNAGYSLYDHSKESPLSMNGLQQHIEENVSLVGIKFGGNMSRVISDSAVTNSSYKSGIIGGFMFGVYYSRFFTLETGLMYEGKGFVKDNTDITEYEVDTAFVRIMDKYDLHARFDYIQVPLYGRVTFGRDVQFYTTFGFNLGIPIQADQEGTVQRKTIIRMKSGISEEIVSPPDTLTGATDFYKGIDITGAIGFGFQWPINPKGFNGPAPSLFVDLKYQRSLMSIGKETEKEIMVGGDKEIIVIPPPELFNEGFAITAGFIFPLSVR
mgnify:CR=1 FL=1